MLNVFIFALISVLLAVSSVCDIRFRIVENRYSFGIAAVCVIGSAVKYFTECNNMAFVFNCIGGFLFAGLITFLAFAISGGIGGADVKILAALGIFWGFSYIPLLMIVSFSCAAIAGLIFKLMLKKKLQRGIPLVPFIFIAHILVYVIYLVY